MLESDVFSHQKMFNTVLEILNEFVLLLNQCLLDDAEKCVYVNADEMSSTKSEASSAPKKALAIETSDGMKPPACCVSRLLVTFRLNEQQRKPCPQVSLRSMVM